MNDINAGQGERASSQGFCESCRRYIGPVGTCPYCGASAPTEPGLRILRIISILLATAGLGTLLFAARQQEIPRLAVKDIAPAMNFAYVHMSGVVVQTPSAGSGKKDRPAYLSFVIDDSTGRIRVQAYGRTAQALAAQNCVPKTGDRVDVCGCLNVAAAADPRLHIEAPEQMRVTRLARERGGRR